MTNVVAAADLPKLLAKQKKPAKYRNVKTVSDGIRFDSKKEAERWLDLLLAHSWGRISKLERQIRYRLDVNGVHIADYVCDAQYIQDGTLVVEDTKGFRTPEYKLKKKLMLACHGIKIQEV